MYFVITLGQRVQCPRRIIMQTAGVLQKEGLAFWIINAENFLLLTPPRTSHHRGRIPEALKLLFHARLIIYKYIRSRSTLRLLPLTSSLSIYVCVYLN